MTLTFVRRIALKHMFFFFLNNEHLFLRNSGGDPINNHDFIKIMPQATNELAQSPEKY